MHADVERRRVRLPDSDHEIAFLDWGGTGPAALLHHANGFCAALWEPVAERLRSDFRVLALDARGHGDSAKPTAPDDYHWQNFPRDVLGFADALADEVDGFALGLGHSFGGTSLVLAAIERPELFARLVLLDPIIPPAPGPASDPLRRAHTQGLADGARRRRQIWTSRAEAREKWASRDIFADWTPRALDLYVEEGLRDLPDGSVELKCTGEVEAAIFERGSSVDVMGMAAQLAVPALIAWAKRGNFPLRHFQDLAGRMGDARVVEVDTGHFVPMEDPEWVAEQALAFSARPDTPAGSSPSSPPAATRCG